MTAALRQDAIDSVAEIVHGLETTRWRVDATLRRAVGHAAEIAPAVIGLVEKAAAGVYLIPKQENLLFWGIHVLAAARRTELYRPLLGLLRQCEEDQLDRVVGDVITETLRGIVISVCDGDAGPLVEACADQNVDSYARWSLIDALARLAFDGTIARETAVKFLDRFEREPLAEPGDDAWQGWLDAVSLLGLEDMRERLRAACDDDRIALGDGDREYVENQLTLARNLAPGDPSLFVRERVVPLDDPVAALGWVQSEEEAETARRKSKKDRPLGPDPAAAIALDGDEIDWLNGFLGSKHVPVDTLGMESMEQIDGFFCAVLAGPEGVSPDDAMPAIWSEERRIKEARPDYDSEQQAEHVANLLTRHWQTISLRLDRSYPHTPVMPWRWDAPRGSDWARGFIRGVSLRLSQWGERSRDDEVIGSFVAAMLAFSDDDQLNIDERGTAGERASFIKVLPMALIHLHCLWRGRPSPYRRHDPVSGPRISRKIGRNEPCPCGSGKKYKRCCGSTLTEPIDW